MIGQFRCANGEGEKYESTTRFLDNLTGEFAGVALAEDDLQSIAVRDLPRLTLKFAVALSDIFAEQRCSPTLRTEVEAVGATRKCEFAVVSAWSRVSGGRAKGLKPHLAVPY